MKTNGHTNGHARTPARPLQFMLDGRLVPVIHDDTDRAGQLLDDYDTAIAELDHALAERNTAGALWDEADRRYRITHERCLLARLALQVQLAGEGVQS